MGWPVLNDDKFRQCQCLRHANPADYRPGRTRCRGELDAFLRSNDFRRCNRVCCICDSDTAAPAPGACSLFTIAEAKKFSDAAKFFDLIPPQEDRFGNGSSCSYADFIVKVDPFPFATIDAERKKPGERFEAVPGVGDVAYVRENTRIGAAEILYRVGQRVVTIQMDLPTGQTYGW